MGRKALNYKEYMASDVWKCKNSPTAAHHWLEVDNTELFYCKWCYDTKEFPTGWNKTYPMDAVRLEEYQVIYGERRKR